MPYFSCFCFNFGPGWQLSDKTEASAHHHDLKPWNRLLHSTNISESLRRPKRDSRDSHLAVGRETGHISPQSMKGNAAIITVMTGVLRSRDRRADRFFICWRWCFREVHRVCLDFRLCYDSSVHE